MIVERVVLENFGSFFKRTEIDLSVEKAKNIVLIVGHGGAGKTTVGKAIRWALYNRPFHGSDQPFQANASGQTDPEYSREEVLNIFFREGGGGQNRRPPDVNQMSVQLYISPSEAVKAAMVAHGLKFGRYLLERSALVSKIIPNSKDVILPPLLLKGPDQRVVDDPIGIIDEFFLPASTSAFFMFHGDRIRDLTKQIDQPVTSAIRQILDVTAMKNAELDLEKVASRFNRQISSTLKDEGTRTRKQRAADQLEQDLDKQSGILRQKNENYETKKQELEKLSQEQRDLIELEGFIEKYDNKQRDLDSVLQKLESVEESIRTELYEFPREVLYHVLAPKASEYEKIDSENKRHQAKIEQLKAQRSQIEELKPGQKCPTCFQTYPQHMVNERQREIGKIEDKIQTEAKSIEYLRPEYLELLRAVNNLETASYDPEKLFEQRFNLRSQKQDIENELEGIKKEVGSSNNASVRARARKVAEDVREKSRQVGNIETEIKELNRTFNQTKEAKDQLEREIAQLAGGTSKKLTRYYEDASKLRRVFAECVEELADQKRQEIATEAGKMLMGTTIKPELFRQTAPIDVDSEFHVRPINVNGDILAPNELATSERSCLSLSFIYGLLKASEREAPVILDTFFGNLDPNQIKNITAQLSNFSTQVVLMTTLTEWQDLCNLASSEFWKKVNRYIFLRDSASTGFITQVKDFETFASAEKEAQAQIEEFGERKR